MISRGKLVVSEAFRSIGANLSTSFAATMTVLISMVLLGLLIALGTYVVSWSDHIKSQLEVRMFFTEDVTPAQVNAVGAYLRQSQADGDIKSYQFVSRADALRIMRKRNPDLAKSLTTNPLPASYEATPADPDFVKTLSRQIRAEFNAPVCKNGVGDPDAASGVECVRDGEQRSEAVLKYARAIEAVFLVAVLVLLGSSILLIGNTIRLSIFSRRREIEVMKLVGATNWFVRGPFMVEGLLCGLFGALAAVAVLVIGKEVALPSILRNIDSSDDVRALGFTLTALILLVVGLGVGAVGSGLTLRRHLKV